MKALEASGVTPYTHERPNHRRARSPLRGGGARGALRARGLQLAAQWPRVPVAIPGPKPARPGDPPQIRGHLRRRTVRRLGEIRRADDARAFSARFPGCEPRAL